VQGNGRLPVTDLVSEDASTDVHRLLSTPLHADDALSSSHTAHAHTSRRRTHRHARRRCRLDTARAHEGRQHEARDVSSSTQHCARAHNAFQSVGELYPNHERIWSLLDNVSNSVVVDLMPCTRRHGQRQRVRARKQATTMCMHTQAKQTIPQHPRCLHCPSEASG